MQHIKSIVVERAKQYIEERKPKNGAGLFAHKLFQDKTYRGLVPLQITQEQYDSPKNFGFTGWDETIPALLRAFQAISSGLEECSVGVQMLQATDKDFPNGEDFEIESRPYRFTHDGVVYFSAPLETTSSVLLENFIKLDIGFDTILILFDSPFRTSWFDLSESEKEASILAIAYDANDGESFIYASAERHLN